MKYNDPMKFFEKYKRAEVRIDNEPHTVLFWELTQSKDSEYESEAHALLVSKHLSKVIGNFRIEYDIANGDARYEMFALNAPDEVVAGMEGPLPSNKKNQIDNIKELFAHSEATALIDSK